MADRDRTADPTAQALPLLPAACRVLARYRSRDRAPEAARCCWDPMARARARCCACCTASSRPATGSIMWGDALDRPRGQAMVFQRPVLLRRSAAENIRYALHLAGVRGAEADARIAEALDEVGLARARASRPARVLSGGEQQKLAFARVWALRPEVLFLDEPTASLDPAAARAVEQIVARHPCARHDDRHDHAQSRAGEAPGRRHHFPARGSRDGAHARRRIFRGAALARGGRFSGGRTTMNRRNAVALLVAFACCRSCPLPRRRNSSSSPRRRRPSSRACSGICCRSSRRTPASRCAWWRSAQGRRSIWPAAAMRMLHSSTIRRPRRNSSRKDPASSAFRSCTTTSC